MIEFKNVSKTYANGTHALKDLSISVDDGEFIFIVGQSGAGKSTFLKLITCEERPTSGDIIVGEQHLPELKRSEVPYLRRMMGMVFQDFRLINKMTVFENVAFAMHVVGASTREIHRRVPYILSLVNLQDKAQCHPRELSGGEQQRVGLARALVNSPKLLIADEPTGNVDPALSFEIVDLLTQINKRGTTILMVTHEQSLVRHFQRRTVEINSGTVISDTCSREVEYD